MKRKEIMLLVRGNRQMKSFGRKLRKNIKRKESGKHGGNVMKIEKDRERENIGKKEMKKRTEERTREKETIEKEQNEKKKRK